MARCISPVYVKRSNIHVPCGKCNFCLETRRNEWSFRLNQELKVSVSSYFLTLTYDSDHLVFSLESRLPTLNVSDTQTFIKRLRKAQGKVCDVGLRYYLCGEYGDDSERPHYHMIIFNLHADIVGREVIQMLKYHPEGVYSPKLSEIWRGGIVHVGTCTQSSIHYTTKYVVNRHRQYPGRDPPFSTMSRKPGLGSNYISTHKQWHVEAYRNFTQEHGIVARLPRFYKDRIFEPWERMHLARLAMDQVAEAEVREVERLKKLVPDPLGYMDERTRYAHDTIFRRLNEKSKL